MSNSKNLIFDLGGVIIDLHVDRTLRAFSTLAGVEEEYIRRTYSQQDFFQLYETGKITDIVFRNSIRDYLKTEIDDESIDHAWNAMLGNIPSKRLERLKQLSRTHRVFLLSNTNAIHLTACSSILQSVGGEDSLDAYFEKAYYSHKVNMRKPQEDIFLHVLEESNLNPEETLFLDDTKENLLTADKLKINTFHVHYPDEWLGLFHE